MADATHRYGPTEGLPALRDALVEKLATENGLTGVEVMVTAGANQVIWLSLCGLSVGGELRCYETKDTKANTERQLILQPSVARFPCALPPDCASRLTPT